MTWKIVFYETSGGQLVVEKFIDSLQKVPRSKLLRELDLLEEHGIQLGMPHARPMKDGLYELRVRSQIDIRCFYIFAKGQHIYILHGFVKKRQTTPKRELDIARERQKEISNL